MLYAIMGQDVENSLERRLSVRPKHLERVQQLIDEGRVLIAGPHPAIDDEDPGEAGFTGSLIVAEYGSLAEAEAWAGAAPYVEAGVYASVTVKPFKKIAP